MKLNRLGVFAILLLLLAAAVQRLAQGYAAPRDGTGWLDCPSRIVLADDGLKTPEIVDQEGKVESVRFLTAVGGRPVESLKEVESLLSDLDPSTVVLAETWDSGEGRERTLRMSVAALLSSLREVGPAIYLRDVVAGGPAARAGLRQGDVILKVGDRGLEKSPWRDPFDHFLAASSFGRGGRQSTSTEADRILRSRKPGDVLDLEVLRRGEPRRFAVRLESTALSYSFLLPCISGLFLLTYGFFLLVRGTKRTFDALPAAIGYCLILAPGRDPSYPAQAILQDLVLLLPFLAVQASRRLPPVYLWRGRPRRSRFYVRFGQPSIEQAAWLAFPFTVLIFLLPEILPVWMASGFKERVIEPGTASIVIFGLIGWTFLFGAFYLVEIAVRILTPTLPTRAENAELAARITNGPLKSVEDLFGSDPSFAGGYLGSRVVELGEAYSRNPEPMNLAKRLDDLVDLDEEVASHAFLVIRWSEMALPLLGFLGTVLGIGWALPKMSNVLRSEGEKSAVLDSMVVAFKDLGLAFDTTLAGLVGVLLLGVVHSFMERRLRISFSATRALLGRYCDLLEPLPFGQLAMALPARLEEKSPRSGQLAGILQTLIAGGQKEPWLEMRRVLYRPLLPFESVSFCRPVLGFLKSSKLGEGWSVKALVQGGSAGDLLAVVSDPGSQNRLLRFRLDGEGEPVLQRCGANVAHAVSSAKGDRLVILTTARKLLDLANSEGDVVELPSVTVKVETETRIWALEVGSLEFLLVEERGGGVTKLWCRTFGGSTRFELEATGWEGLAVHSASAMVMGVKRVGSGWRLERYVLAPAKERDAPPALERRGFLELPIDAKETPRVFAISGEEALVVAARGDQDGFGRKERSYYGDLSERSTGTLVPIVVPPEWPNRVAAVQVGRGRWFAVRSDSDAHLSMWRFLPGGILEPYKEDGVVKRDPSGAGALVATRDGRFLVAGEGQVLAAWRFPKLAVEDLGK